MTTLEEPLVTYLLHSVADCSFAGVRCAQLFADFYVWESVLNGRQRKSQEGVPNLKTIVELGTFEGGFSLYLASQAQWRNLDFRTYDVVPPQRKIPGFVQLDIFAKADAIGRHLERHDPLVLFCDGGNKPRELRTFAPYLSQHSIIAVHDWGTEVFEENVPHYLEMIYQEFCEEMGSMTRFFVRNDLDD